MPAFLHGEILVGWFFASAIAIFAAVIIGLWLWRFPPRAPSLPAAIYLVTGLTGSVLWMMNASDLLWSSIGFALTLPWSAAFLFAVMQFEVPAPVWLMVLGIPLNATLMYLALRWRGRRRAAAGKG